MSALTVMEKVRADAELQSVLGSGRALSGILQDLRALAASRDPEDVALMQLWRSGAHRIVGVSPESEIMFGGVDGLSDHERSRAEAELRSVLGTGPTPELVDSMRRFLLLAHDQSPENVGLVTRWRSGALRIAGLTADGGVYFGSTS